MVEFITGKSQNYFLFFRIGNNYEAIGSNVYQQKESFAPVRIGK
jgi:hypothetical protein